MRTRQQTIYTAVVETDCRHDFNCKLSVCLCLGSGDAWSIGCRTFCLCGQPGGMVAETRIGLQDGLLNCDALSFRKIYIIVDAYADYNSSVSRTTATPTAQHPSWSPKNPPSPAQPATKSAHPPRLRFHLHSQTPLCPLPQSPEMHLSSNENNLLHKHKYKLY